MRDVLIYLVILSFTALLCLAVVKAQPRYGAYLPLVVADCEVHSAWNNTCYSYWPR